MLLKTQEEIINMVREEHLIQNDFFLRWIEFFPKEGERILSLTFSLLHQNEVMLSRQYSEQQISFRLEQGAQECSRYRLSSMQRILGLNHRPKIAFMDEYFLVYTSAPVDTLQIQAKTNFETVTHQIPVREYRSQNRYFFPIHEICMVSDTYPCINSHRWCRNSEFAFDVGSPDLFHSDFSGTRVYAACKGVVVESFDGLEDSDENTDFDKIEAQFSEHERIDGNHVLIAHPNGEYSLYAHLQKGSVKVKTGDSVNEKTCIGRVGSSGNSRVPHLHFHLMKDGMEGAGIPVIFQDTYTHFSEPCLLNDPLNLIFVKPH